MLSDEQKFGIIRKQLINGIKLTRNLNELMTFITRKYKEITGEDFDITKDAFENATIMNKRRFIGDVTIRVNLDEQLPDDVNAHILIHDKIQNSKVDVFDFSFNKNASYLTSALINSFSLLHAL